MLRIIARLSALLFKPRLWHFVFFSLFLLPAAQAADLSMNVAATPAQGTQDQELTYTVSIFPVRTNTSTVVNDVVFSYGLPTGFTLVSATPTQGTCVTGQVLECDLGDLSTLQTVSIVVVPTQTGTVTSSLFAAGLKLNETTNTVENTTTSVTVTTVVVEPPAVQLDFSQTSYSVTEAGGEAVFSVSLTGDNSGRSISVDYATSDGTATAGVDYTAASGTLTWAAGDTTPKTFSVLITDDQVVEKDETVNLTLSNATNSASIGAGSAVLTIVSDESAGTIGFSSVNYSVYEADSSVQITVNRNDGGDGEVSVTYSTSNGSATQYTDYLPASGTLVWANGDTSAKSFTVNILATDDIKADRTVNLLLDNANTAVLGQRSATLTIIDTISTADAVSALESVARNPAQKAMATSLGNLCQSGQAGRDLQARCRELIINVPTDPDAVSNALQQIAPEELSNQGRLAIEASSRQSRNLRTRLQALRRGSEGASLSDLKVDVQGVPVPEAVGLPKSDIPIPESLPTDVAHKYGLNKLGLFLSGEVGFGDKTATDREGGMDFETLNLTAGADYRISNQFILGAAFGYGNGDVDFHSNGGAMKTDSYSYSLYATYFQTGAFYVDGIFSFGSTDFDAERNVNYSIASTRVEQIASSSARGDRSTFVIEAGYDFKFNELLLTPTARLDYMKVDIDPFKESMSSSSTPGSGLALGFEGQSIKSTTLGLGLLTSYEIKTEWATLKPELQVEWVHELDNNARNINGYFVDDRGRYSFALPTDDPDKQYLNIGAGLTLDYGKGQSAFLSYQTVFGLNNFSYHALMLGYRLELN